jgi:hypothetical protein
MRSAAATNRQPPRGTSPRPLDIERNRVCGVAKGAPARLAGGRLLRTSKESSTPLDGVDAMHRHDISARAVRKRWSSNTVAIAFA